MTLLPTYKKKAGRSKRGFQIIEIVIGAAIFLNVVLAVDYSMNTMYLTSRKSLRTAQASYLVEETTDVLKALRDNGWNNISALNIDVNYYLTFTGGAWTITSTPTLVDGFSRAFVLSTVYRNASDDIAASGTADLGARKVAINISWSDNGKTYSKSISTYIFDI